MSSIQYHIKTFKNYHRESYIKQKTFKNNSYGKYTAYIALATSILGLYYYISYKNIYALNKKFISCGEFRVDLKTYNLEEVGKHDNKENRIWVTFKQGVYDITDFIEKHPGGSSKI